MARDALQRASEALQAAAEAAEDAAVRERLHGQSEQLANLAAAERGPDHGRLARHERAIDEAAGAGGGAVREHADDALAAIREHRETLEGV